MGGDQRPLLCPVALPEDDVRAAKGSTELGAAWPTGSSKSVVAEITVSDRSQRRADSVRRPRAV